MNKGFTIIELLIVVVVIAILAAITVVAFTGIQERAKNTQRVAAAKDWQKIIGLYVATKNRYPHASGMDQHYCLGNNNETNWDANPDQDCAWSTNIKHTGTGDSYAEFGSLPNFPNERIYTTSTIFVGGISIRAHDSLINSDGSSVPYAPTLLYWLKGQNQDCVLRPLVIPVSGGLGVTNEKNSGNVDNATYCRVLLPIPES